MAVRMSGSNGLASPCPRGLLTDREHALEGYPGVSRGCFVDDDAVSHLSFDEAVEHPGEVSQVDAEHRRAGTHERVEGDHGPVRVLARQAVYEMDLGSHRHRGAGLGGCDRGDDVVRGADLVGDLDDLAAALGMHDHDAVGVLGAKRRHVLGPEPLVNRTVPLPQKQGRFFHFPVLQAPEAVAGVDHLHVRSLESEPEAGVAP